MTELDDAMALAWEGGGRPAAPAVGSVVVGRGELTEGWVIGRAVNGGLLMALAAKAAAAVLDDAGHGAPLTWGAHFLSAAVVGPVEVRVEPLRLGRTVSTVSVALVQETGSGAAERVRPRLPFIRRSRCRGSYFDC